MLLSRATVLVPCFLAALLICLNGCSSAVDEDPRLRERSGRISGPALTRFLTQASRLTGTPLAARANDLLGEIKDCQDVFFHAPGEASGAEESSALDGSSIRFFCLDEPSHRTPLSAWLRQERGAADGFVTWPLEETGHVAMRVKISAEGALEINGTARPPNESGIFNLFVPSTAEPDAATLSSGKALVQARWRPANGLGLSDLMPAGGQADRMFALKGRLLEGALLSGTWEFAFMPPVENGELPLAIGALHHRSSEAIELALGEVLDQLESTWPIVRTPQAFRTAQGAPIEGGCFNDLPLLPELAPCWVVTPNALLVGYRSEAIDRALAPPAVSSAPPSDSSTSPGSLVVHFDRMAKADRRQGNTSSGVLPGDVFSKFEFGLSPAPDGQVAIHAELSRSVQ